MEWIGLNGMEWIRLTIIFELDCEIQAIVSLTRQIKNKMLYRKSI